MILWHQRFIIFILHVKFIINSETLQINIFVFTVSLPPQSGFVFFNWYLNNIQCVGLIFISVTKIGIYKLILL